MNLPNRLTLMRIFIIPVFVVVLLTEVEGKNFVGTALFILAAITDLIDGHLARSRNEVTRLGKFLDPIADKLLTSAAFISLVEMGRAPAWIVVVIIGREFAVTGLRSIAATEGVVIAAERLGKYKMVAQIVAIIALLLDVPYHLGTVALWVAMFLAVVSGIQYFMGFWSAFEGELS